METKIASFRIYVCKILPFIEKNRFTKKLADQLFTLNFFRFLITGFSTFFLQIFLLYLISSVFSLEKEKANIFSSLLSLVFNYIMSNYWTFQAGNGKHTKKIGKYFILVTFNYIFDVLLAFPFLSLTLKINPYLTKVIITATVMCWNFFIYKFWVFKK